MNPAEDASHPQLTGLTTAQPSLRILAVEDDRLQGRALRLHLLALGYDMPLEATTAEQAEALFIEHAPDLVLLDIHLGPGSDGIALANRLRTRRATPFIFLTSAHDLATFERASAADPHAFLTKPYDRDALYRAIELAARYREPRPSAAPAAPEAAPDHLWLRDGSRLVRATMADILCIEADDSYLNIFTVQGRKFTVRQSLRELEESLPAGLFLRVHRSFLVQISRIESVDLPNATLTVGPHTLPFSRSYREELVRCLGLKD